MAPISQLDNLKKNTLIVADTGDFEAIEKFKPVDATTNPSLVMQAISMKKYSHFVDKAVAYAQKLGGNNKDRLVELAVDYLSVLIGKECLNVISGRVSTEVDASLSFDVDATVSKAINLIEMYNQLGVPKERVLIKVAATWEGISAAKILEQQHGIHCNLTLIFSLVQAVACAEAGVTLISPFVGRILDWYVKNTDVKSYTQDDDPGVLSVKEIYNYYKFYNYKSTIMGASFRNKDQILALNGIDALTISPKLLEELHQSTDQAPVMLSVEHAKALSPQKIRITESNFRWMMNENAMATEKLAEGIRTFNKDSKKVRAIISAKIGGI